MDAEKSPPTWPDAETAFIAEMKRQRTRQGLSQGDLAERVKVLGGNMFQQTIAKLESGQRALRMAEADLIAAALGMTMTGMLAAAYAPEPRTELADTKKQLDRVNKRLAEVAAETHVLREEMAGAERQLAARRSRLEGLTSEAAALEEVRQLAMAELGELGE